MLSFPTLATLLATASLTQAHYAVVRLAHNGKWQPPLSYIRNLTNPFNETPVPRHSAYRGFAFPTWPSDAANSVRCGRGNMDAAAATEVLQVQGGDTVEFVFVGAAISPDKWDDKRVVQWECPDGRGACNNVDTSRSVDDFWLFHLGPVMMHLSKVPAGQDVDAYDGSGEWVKIYNIGLEIRRELSYPVFWLPENGHQLPPRFIATIPKQTPAGKYLLRVDQPYYGSGNSDAQMYPTCAQIEVVGGVSGDLPKGIKIPEDLQNESPGMFLTPNFPNDFTYPGGPLWDGEKLEQDYPPKL